MKIRPFINADYPAILGIYNKSKLDEFRFEDNYFELLPLEKDEKRFSEFKRSDIFVCEEGEIFGYGALHGSEITALFVHPDKRGKGIGKSLLGFLLSKIEGSSSLYVAKSNTPAKLLYEKYGFIVVDEFETEYNRIPVFANRMIRNAKT